MHPPFYVVDHKIGQSRTLSETHVALAHDEKRIIRRNRPEALRLTLPPPDLPMAIYTPVRAAAPALHRFGVMRWLARFLRRRSKALPLSDL